MHVLFVELQYLNHTISIFYFLFFFFFFLTYYIHTYDTYFVRVLIAFYVTGKLCKRLQQPACSQSRNMRGQRRFLRIFLFLYGYGVPNCVTCVPLEPLGKSGTRKGQVQYVSGFWAACTTTIRFLLAPQFSLHMYIHTYLCTPLQ